VFGFALMTAWYGLLAGLFVSHLLHPTEVPSRLTPPWEGILAVTGLVAIWVVANRFRPDFGVALPRRRSSRSARAGQGG
jgi:hypothetical protein